MQPSYNVNANNYYNMAHAVPSMPPSPYTQMPYDFGSQPYHHAPQTQHPTYKQMDRPTLTIPPQGNAVIDSQTRSAGYSPRVHQSRSPSTVRSEPSSAKPTSGNPMSKAKTITANAALDPKLEVQFKTPVDVLLKTLQAKKETADLIQMSDNEKADPSIPPSPAASLHTSPMVSNSRVLDGRIKKTKNLKFTCNIEGCEKAFAQRTQLEVHVRAHSGEQPYVSFLVP